MFSLILVIHVLICIALVIVVLMQSSKGEGLAGAFGGGGGLSGAVFGGRGAASFLSKATTVLAIAFMVTCLILSFLSSSKFGSKETTVKSVVTEKAAGTLPMPTSPTEGTNTANPEDIFNTPAGQAADSTK